MHTIPYIQERIRQAFLELRFEGHPAALYEPIGYSLSMGGKRIRPLLTLLSCDLFGGNIEKALPAALGIEIFHNFTLVHDDIMDKALLRRGHLPVYLKWDMNTAILAGDTMFALAYHYFTKTDPSILPEVLQVFNQTAREVCEGQQLDMIFEDEPLVAIEDYLEMIRLKTAVLLGCCLKTGCLIAGAGKKDAEDLYHFGQNLGIAFQLQDDLLDTFGEEETFGKKTGGDIITNKKTYLYLKSLEIANEEQKNTLQSCYTGGDMDSETKVLLVKGILTELNIEQLTRTEIERFYRKAINNLLPLSLPEAKKEVLLGFTDELMKRTY